MFRLLVVTFWGALGLLVAGSASAAMQSGPPAAESSDDLQWHEDYAEAMDEAEVEARMLLIFFYATGENATRDAFERESLSDPDVRQLLKNFTLCRLPVDATIRVDGVETTLLEHPAFGEMQRHQGIAILDYANWDNEDVYGHVVSTFPFLRGKYYRPEALKVILDLPVGTLTQRTMIFAVRMHPERPQSTEGEWNPILRSEAESHSYHQARIRSQGHHRWGFRFNRIISRLAGGATAQEVVAESWPGQGLVEACHDCVHSWRQSSGHWSAVRSRHSAFAYDIKRGANGVWYATGIFATRR